MVFAAPTPQALQLRVETPVVELLKLNVPLLNAMPRVGISQTLIQRPVNLAGAESTGEVSTVDITTFSNDIIRPAALDIGAHRLRSSFTISNGAYHNAQSDPNLMADLLSIASRGAQRSLIRQLGRLIIRGTGSATDAGIIGCQQINTTFSGATGFVTSTNAYAGIDPTVAGQGLWRQLRLIRAAAFNLTDLMALEVELLSGDVLGSAGNYNVVLAHPRDAQRIKDAAAGSNMLVQTAGETMVAGYSDVTYSGRPVVADPNVTEGQIHLVLLDRSNIALYLFDQEADSLFGVERDIQDIPMYVYQLPSSNPETQRFGIYLKAQVFCADRHTIATYQFTV